MMCLGAGIVISSPAVQGNRALPGFVTRDTYHNLGAATLNKTDAADNVSGHLDYLR